MKIENAGFYRKFNTPQLTIIFQKKKKKKKKKKLKNF